MLPFTSERPGGASTGASGQWGGAQADDDALLQEAGGTQGKALVSFCSVFCCCGNSVLEMVYVQSDWDFFFKSHLHNPILT